MLLAALLATSSAAADSFRCGQRIATTIEKWTYDRGSQSFDMVVTIVDGTIKSIRREK
ncbi:MAG: DUF2845 domain-containing protein [Gammaproteobacteria bacterium]|nr:DUF2845 domain-containing protein [Gammaproteobacteria bacterium]